MCEQRLTGHEGCNQRRERREHQHAPAAEGKPDQKAKPEQDAGEAHKRNRPALRQQHVEVGGGALAEILAMRGEECVGAAAPFLLQHAHETPLGIEFRGGAEVGELVSPDAVRAHAGPARALAVSGIRHLTQQRDHAQFLHQR